MSLPLLPPTSDTHFTVSGNVTVHPGSAIAPGVILQADPGSRIIIEAGVCIGMGSLLHACSGHLVVGQGAILGAQVLLIGPVQIGANACLGPGVTVFDSTVAEGAVILAGSYIGNAGRSPTFSAPSHSPTDHSPGRKSSSVPHPPVDESSQSPPPSPNPSTAPDPSNNPAFASKQVFFKSHQVFYSASMQAQGSLDNPWDEALPTDPAPPEAASPPPAVGASQQGEATPLSAASGSSTPPQPPEETPSDAELQSQVYGQASLHRLVGMLFPHRQSLDAPSSHPDDDD